MSIYAELEDAPLTLPQVEALWNATRTALGLPDDQVNIRVVSSQEMRTLNRDYGGKDRPTNVLTFSYPADAPVSQVSGGEHDIVVCLEVAESEAQLRGVSLADYVALLLVHGFLHAAGMDHEKSIEEAVKTSRLEREILSACKFTPVSLE